MGRERFLVTGAAGFIGGHTVDRLVALGHDVVGLDDFSTGSPGNTEASLGKFTFIEGSVSDAPLVARALEGVRLVIHLAAVPSVPRSVADPLESARASVIGTVTLLEEARKAGVARVVQASSCAVYGDAGAVPQVEDSPPAPMSPYAAAKLAQEHYALAFYRCHGLDSASLRYFNVFGPRQNPDSEYAAVIPRFIAMMKRGERPIIYGDGGQSRDFIHVDDVVEANIGAALCPKPLRGEAMNIGCGRSFSMNELVRQLNGLLGTGLEPVYGDKRPGEVYENRADVNKARMMFGYVPKIDFGEGLKRTVESFR